MNDRVKLLIGVLSDDDENDKADVTVFEVAAMLEELGEGHRQRARAVSALATSGH